MLFKENSIIICSQNTKKKILEDNFRQKKLFNATFFSLQEFINRLTFKITDEAIVYSKNFLGISYENAKTIVPNIYYIDTEEEYFDNKLIELQNLMKELIANNLLEYDSLFKEFLRDKTIYLVDLFLDHYSIELISKLEETNEIIYHKSLKNDKTYEVVSFEHYADEVDYVFSQIYSLLEKGVDINNIYIVSQSDEYRHLINRYSQLYQIDTFMKENESIKNHKIVKKVFDLLSREFNKDEILNELINEKDTYVINQIVSLFNRFYFVDDVKELIEILEVEIANISYESKRVHNTVKVVDLSYSFNSNEHVFLLGFNSNSIPKINIDDDYLTDKYSVVLPITTTDEKNKLERNKAIYLLSNINNLYISYARFTQTENLVSVLFDYLNCKKIEGSSKCGISRKVDILKVGTMIDDLINFNVHDSMLDILYSSLNPNYKSYDNTVDLIDKELLRKRMNSFIGLSYSSISTYYKCQFSYYLERVLKIKHNSDKSAAQIGTMFHAILEKYGTAGFDVEKEKQNQLSQVEDNSIKFYFEKLWPDFMVVFEMIDSFNEKTYLKEELHEQEVTVDYSNDLYQMLFTGKIDKIVHTNIDGVDYVSVVDYKTGSSDVASFNNVEYGFNLQLPVYAYFLVKSTLFKNPKILGLYLQKVLNDCKPTKKKDLHSVQLEALKLQGYSTVEREELAILDPTYKSSSYIKSMSITKEGVFGRYAKVYSNNDLIKIIETVEDLIKDAFEEIQEGTFTINPKEIKGVNQSCTFCKFANICYKTNKDIKVLEEKKFVETVEDGE